MTYFITCTSSDAHWHKIRAKTLTGAKRCASQYYNDGGDLMVCQTDDENPDYRTVVATKTGFGKWRNIL